MSDQMKALVVRQPWATLIALGVKTIETRPGPPNGPMRPDGVRGLPGCTLELGERIAIVAGTAAPAELPTATDYHVGRHTAGVGVHTSEDCACPDPEDAQWSPECAALNVWRPALLHDERAHGFSIVAPLPLGAVVCTVVVADALPIIDTTSAPMHYGNPVVRVVGSAIAVHPQLTLYSVQAGLDEVRAQLPLGDFTPGRWSWMLTDPQPCEPIPVTGRQGVFELPDDVAGAIS